MYLGMETADYSDVSGESDKSTGDRKIVTQILIVSWLLDIVLCAVCIVSYFWSWQTEPLYGVGVLALILAVGGFVLWRLLTRFDDQEDEIFVHAIDTNRKVQPRLDGYYGAESQM